MIKNKYCPKCKKTRLIKSFSKNKTRKNGVDCYCKQCHRIYRKTNKIMINKQRKGYRIKNKNKIK